jgi:ACS family hexuronate transporter-like MFS transporter
MYRWRIAILVSAAIAISYLDRQTLPWTLSQIKQEISFSDQGKAALDSAFLLTYGIMYFVGGRLLDALGTRRGFIAIMVFWSLACASHALAGSYGMGSLFGQSFAFIMLAASRLLLGVGEGGGFPAATRAVAEWFPVNERSTAMGIINAGTAIGAVIAPFLIGLILWTTLVSKGTEGAVDVGWLGIAPWRWVYIVTGALGLLWTLWWYAAYDLPERHARVSQLERDMISTGQPAVDPLAAPAAAVPVGQLLTHPEILAVVGAKFLSDAAWYFYIFWLPKFFQEQFEIKFFETMSIAWIPYAAAGVGCLVGGGLSSWLLQQGYSVNASRKIALGASAAFMPWVMMVPSLDSKAWATVLFSLAFFGQQSWSTLVMILPTDMIPKRSVGTVAGMVGFGGAMGGVVLGQIAGYLRDHDYSYTPIMIISGSLHVLAFILICVVIPRIRSLTFDARAPV